MRPAFPFRTTLTPACPCRAPLQQGDRPANYQQRRLDERPQTGTGRVQVIPPATADAPRRRPRCDRSPVSTDNKLPSIRGGSLQSFCFFVGAHPGAPTFFRMGPCSCPAIPRGGSSRGTRRSRRVRPAGIDELEDQNGGVLHSMPIGGSLVGVLCTDRRRRSIGDQRLGLSGWQVPVTA